ncbi:mannose-6-phosphate isomerase, partial [Xanthomonas citri pv. citri]|nr:mannose-6-phosphate isomerase [Xanthomonas citri pv. citri]
DDAELILGHHASTKEEFKQRIESGDWNGLLRRIKIKPGDFFYVPSGTLHALCKGTLVLEIQQNSDTTYRVYDYDRCNDQGQKRTLHIEKA